MKLILALVMVFAVIVLPVKVAADLLGAENSTLFRCTLCILGSFVSLFIAADITDHVFLQYLIGFIVTPVFYSLFLEVGYVQALFISLLTSVLQAVVMYLLWGSMALGTWILG
ncbi:hypothetical protein L2725_09755 [Shewanella corallii]|uniref:Uncharacterized protein n=1 Tax=Shewanella corallii TaxID=560080 RepID=A0ABT0N6R2_9GAMM|nr:hypothetical protein [Shewanella corallii]MCL2914070.1 hypothetical protein [Shewanella corallii]